MHLVNCAFYTDAGLKRIPDDFLDAEKLRALQSGSRLALKSTVSQKIHVTGTITLNIITKNSKIRAAFSVLHNLAVPVFLGTSFIDRFLNIIFPPELKIVPYISKRVPILAIEDISEEPKDNEEDKSQDVMIVEEDVTFLVRVTR